VVVVVVAQEHTQMLHQVQPIQAGVEVVLLTLVMVALASSSFVTLQHKAHPHHLVAQTHLKFHTLTGIKSTLGLHLEL
jgi:hypothetical protein